MITGLMACALVGGAVTATPDQISERLVVTDEGDRVVTEYHRNGAVSRLNQDQGYIDNVTEPRWEEGDNGEGWIARTIAVGDNGAAVFAGKGLNNEALTMYSSLAPDQVFNFDINGAEDPPVAVADRAPRAAGMVIFDTDPDPAIFEFEATVHAFETTGDGTPEWSHTFPVTANYYGGGVTLSDDGNVILAWKANPYTETLMIEAFNWDGSSISSGEHQVIDGGNVYFHSRQTRLSNDGSRAYFNIGTYAVIYDIATATVEFEHRIGASFDSHALSGDGKRFAYGNFGYFRVYNEESQGNWSQIASKSFSGSVYVARVALNEDGSRCGYQVQRYSPAYDHIELGLYDVNGNDDFFNISYDAPGTGYQLACSGVDVDDAGEYVAGASWGDSFDSTPTGFVYDDAGNATAEITTDGSVFSMDLDADGDVMALGSKAVHANEFGRGGAVTVADAFDYTLSVTGYPQIGGSIQIYVPPVGRRVRIVATDELGSTPTPLGPTEVDLRTLRRDSGFLPIPGGGLFLNVNLPNNPAFAGRAIHLQGAIPDGPGLTNKVSIRILP